MNKIASGLALSAALVMTSGVAHAERYKVYGYKSLDAGESELVYWTNYAVDSDLQQNFFGKTVDRKGYIVHSAEIEYGVTDKFSLAAYLDFEQPSGESLKLTQAHAVVARYRMFEKGEHFFDPAIYVEYYIPRESYQGEGKEKIEARVILQKDLSEKTHLKLNPKFEKMTSGPDVSEGVEFEYGAGIYHDTFAKAALGLEVFGQIGEFAKIKPSDEQTHYILPNVEFKVMDGVSWNVGAGLGLTDASDKVIVKSILEIEL